MAKIVPFTNLSDYETHSLLNECRICLESSGNLIVTCNCKGSCEFVHQECIETWINSFPKDHRKHNVCEICKSSYNLEIINEQIQYKVVTTSCKFIIGILLFTGLLFIFFIILMILWF